MNLYADVHYPRELIADHLIGGLEMHIRIINASNEGDGDWYAGILNGMRIIHSKEWITDELDCFKQYRAFKP